MGSQLAGLAAAALTLALAVPARADDDKPADLVKQGLDAYKAGDYETAITALSKALELEPSFDTEFALAQAQRLGGHCDAALPHYKALLDATTDLTTGRLIHTSMDPCVPKEPPKPPPPPPPKPAPPPPPRIIVREGKPNLTTLAVIGGGAIALGVSATMFYASHENRGDADAAASFSDHVKIENRADRQRIYGIATLVAGAGLIGYGVYRWQLPSSRAEVALVPTADGAAVFARGSF